MYSLLYVYIIDFYIKLFCIDWSNFCSILIINIFIFVAFFIFILLMLIVHGYGFDVGTSLVSALYTEATRGENTRERERWGVIVRGGIESIRASEGVGLGALAWSC